MNELRKKLNIIEKVRFKSWDLYFRIIGEFVRSGELKLLTLIDYRKYHYGNPIEVDILKADTWSTFRDYHRMDLDSNLILTITCEQDAFRDDVETRWVATLQLPEDLLIHFEPAINSYFRAHVADVYEKEEEEKKQKKLNLIAKRLLL